MPIDFFDDWLGLRVRVVGNHALLTTEDDRHLFRTACCRAWMFGEFGSDYVCPICGVAASERNQGVVPVNGGLRRVD